MGPMNLMDALVAHMPHTLYTESGDPVPVSWSTRDSFPDEPPRTSMPRGVLRIITTNPRARSRGPGGLSQTSQQEADSIGYIAGTDTYPVTQRDILSVSSLTGTRAGSPHSFILGTDYEVADRGTIRWLAGDRPDDATPFVVTYQHRLYQRIWEGHSSPVIRAMLYAPAATIQGVEYSKEALACMLGESLEQHLRRRSGRSLHKPPGTSAPYLGEAQAGPVISSMPGLPDASNSIATWIVDFRIHRHHRMSDPPVEAIREAAIDVGETSS